MNKSSNRTIIIAEAGVNHNGDINLAKQLVDQALNAGADYIKFQTFKADDLVTKKASKAKYQILNAKKSESQFDMLKKLELSDNEFIELYEYCQLVNIKFLSSAFDIKDLKFLQQFNMDYYKIPSGEITNLPYLREVSKYKTPIIMSTGMSNLSDIELALKQLVIHGINRNKIILLHCTSQYPALYENLNLKTIKTLRDAFKLDVGYSDHTLGKDIAIAAVALGARIIEKHLTLDVNMDGPDHKASLDPEGFHSMVLSIRNIEISMGTGIKEVSFPEKENINFVRKSLTALKSINKGELFTLENLGAKRPGNGISPMNIDYYLGRKALKNYLSDDLIDE